MSRIPSHCGGWVSAKCLWITFIITRKQVGGNSHDARVTSLTASCVAATFAARFDLRDKAL